MHKDLEQLKKRTAAGDFAAALALADALKWGYYGEVSPARAAELYRRCTAAPSREVSAAAYYNLGVYYYYGLLDEKTDVKKAFDCFMRSALIKPGREALSRLADMYRYGQYVDRDEKIALSLYVKAASA